MINRDDLKTDIAFVQKAIVVSKMIRQLASEGDLIKITYLLFLEDTEYSAIQFADKSIKDQAMRDKALMGIALLCVEARKFDEAIDAIDKIKEGALRRTLLLNSVKDWVREGKWALAMQFICGRLYPLEKVQASAIVIRGLVAIGRLEEAGKLIESAQDQESRELTVRCIIQGFIEERKIDLIEPFINCLHNKQLQRMALLAAIEKFQDNPEFEQKKQHFESRILKTSETL